MPLFWNEIRSRALAFSREWAEAASENAEAKPFWIYFFDVFGVTSKRVASFEEPVKKLGDRQGFIDLFWKGVLLVEHKSRGKDLDRAYDQALDYFPGLKERDLPKYVTATATPTASSTTTSPGPSPLTSNGPPSKQPPRPCWTPAPSTCTPRPRAGREGVSGSTTSRPRSRLAMQRQPRSAERGMGERGGRGSKATSATMADLYDPLTMPAALLKAHQSLDRSVDAAYGKKPSPARRSGWPSCSGVTRHLCRCCPLKSRPNGAGRPLI